MKKILIIDDDSVLRGLVAKKLTGRGYRVEEAKDGEEGVRMIEEIDPDLVLLDIVMPKMNGFDVLREIVNEEGKVEVPIIIVSNSGQPVEIDKAVEMGVKDWIVKTEFDPEEVLNKVADQLGSA